MQAAQKEARATKNLIKAKEEEMLNMQKHYEDELLKKEDQKVEIQAKHKQIADKLQFEIDFLKRELQGQMKSKELMY